MGREADAAEPHRRLRRDRPLAQARRAAESWARMDASSRWRSGPGLRPSSSASVLRALSYARSASACRPERYSATINCPCSRSRS